MVDHDVAVQGLPAEEAEALLDHLEGEYGFRPTSSTSSKGQRVVGEGGGDEWLYSFAGKLALSKVGEAIFAFISRLRRNDMVSIRLSHSGRTKLALGHAIQKRGGAWEVLEDREESLDTSLITLAWDNETLRLRVTSLGDIKDD